MNEREEWMEAIDNAFSSYTNSVVNLGKTLVNIVDSIGGNTQVLRRIQKYLRENYNTTEAYFQLLLRIGRGELDPKIMGYDIPHYIKARLAVDIANRIVNNGRFTIVREDGERSIKTANKMSRVEWQQIFPKGASEPLSVKEQIDNFEQPHRKILEKPRIEEEVLDISYKDIEFRYRGEHIWIYIRDPHNPKRLLGCSAKALDKILEGKLRVTA